MKDGERGMKTIKILNLYAGIGGNRKLWNTLGLDIEVTAIENNEEIAKIYHDFFPNDKVIIADAHEFLLKHYKEFDFIWSSPPCPSHSRMRFIREAKGDKIVYPSMDLYQQILLLKYWFKGKWVIENVITYYEPLIKPQISNNHSFWCNFNISKLKDITRNIRGQDNYKLVKEIGFDLSKFDISNVLKMQVLRNCVVPELGLHIFKMAFKEPQTTLLQKGVK